MKPVIVATAANSMAAYAAGIVALVETAPVRDIGRQSVDYVSISNRWATDRMIH